MKLAVVGSRTFTDYSVMENGLDEYGITHDVTEIISGGAVGADSLAARYAREHWLKLVEIIPDWGKWGKAAGYRRNHEIWEMADAGIVFWDGVSHGAKHSFKIAMELGKPIKVVRVKPGVGGKND